MPINVAYSIASTDSKWKRKCQLYTGINYIDQFLKSMDKLIKEVKDVMHHELTMKKLTPTHEQKQ